MNTLLVHPVPLAHLLGDKAAVRYDADALVRHQLALEPQNERVAWQLAQRASDQRVLIPVGHPRIVKPLGDAVNIHGVNPRDAVNRVEFPPGESLSRSRVEKEIFENGTADIERNFQAFDAFRQAIRIGADDRYRVPQARQGFNRVSAVSLGPAPRVTTLASDDRNFQIPNAFVELNAPALPRSAQLSSRISAVKTYTSVSGCLHASGSNPALPAAHCDRNSSFDQPVSVATCGKKHPRRKPRLM